MKTHVFEYRLPSGEAVRESFSEEDMQQKHEECDDANIPHRISLIIGYGLFQTTHISGNWNYPPEDLATLREFEWTDDYTYKRYLTCVNHQDALYNTKNPFSRNLHILQYHLITDERSPSGECTCPFKDLRVIRSLSGKPE